MSFKTQVKQDAAKGFLNANEFAESVVYTPKEGVPKTDRKSVV